VTLSYSESKGVMDFSKHRKRWVWPYIFLEVDVLTTKFCGTRTERDAEHRIGNANNDLARGVIVRRLKILSQAAREECLKRVGPGWMFDLFSEKRFLSL
jgi:hypothetical protein